MAFRVTIFCTQQAGPKTGGWSENYWNNLTDLTSLQNVMALFLPLRWALMGFGSNIIAYRLQDLTAFRAALPVPLTQFTSTPQGVSSDADYPTTKGLLRLFGPGKYLTNQWLGGFPDNQTTRAGAFTPTNTFVAAFNSFSTHLQGGGNGWVIRSQDKTVAKKLVTAVAQAGQVTAAGSNYVAGSKVRISRTHGVTGLNGLWTVATNVDNNNFTIAPPAGGFIGTVVNPLGTVQLQSALFQGISSATIVRATEHKVGRPFGLFSGKSKKKKS